MNNEEILYQIVAVDSDLKKGFPDEITTILKNGITGKTYTDYDFKNHRYIYCYVSDNFNIYDMLEEKDKEIQRLNNIINELEKDIEEYFKKEYPDRKIENYNLKNCTYDYALVILGKLKELKEGK